MKVKSSRKNRFNALDLSALGTKGYYFHPDEDFREDWNWGKNQGVSSTKGNVEEKEVSGNLFNGTK